MVTNNISKIQAAEKQLSTAIELFLKRKDPVSIHTLGCAAHEIIQSLAERKGIKSMELRALDIIKEDKRKIFRDALKETRNFFKHADKDPENILKFNPELIEFILWDAVRTYYFLTQQKVPLFIAYDFWVYTKYPSLYKMTSEEEKNYKNAVGDITHENKDFFLNWVLEYEKGVRRNIKPDNIIIKFVGKDFGPQSIIFDNDTKIWSVFYVLNDQGINDPSEEIIFNFYFKTLLGDQITPEFIARTFINSGISILGAPFTAPDSITKELNYCITSYSSKPKYGYVNVTRISSIAENVFAITYSKKMVGTAEKLLNNINYWIVKDFESDDGAMIELTRLGLDASWVDYLINKSKT